MSTSDRSTDRATRRDKERRRFERWFRRNWLGISLERERIFGEYTQTAAQTAWEAWWRLTR